LLPVPQGVLVLLNPQGGRGWLVSWVDDEGGCWLVRLCFVDAVSLMPWCRWCCVVRDGSGVALCCLLPDLQELFLPS